MLYGSRQRQWFQFQEMSKWITTCLYCIREHKLIKHLLYPPCLLLTQQRFYTCPQELSERSLCWGALLARAPSVEQGLTHAATTAFPMGKHIMELNAFGFSVLKGLFAHGS